MEGVGHPNYFVPEQQQQQKTNDELAGSSLAKAAEVTL